MPKNAHLGGSGGGGRGGGVKNFFPYPNELLIWAYPENFVKIRLLVQELVKGGGVGRGLWVGGREGGLGGKYFFPHPNKLLILAYPKNLVKFGLLIEAVDTFCGMEQVWHGDGHTLHLYRQSQH